MAAANKRIIFTANTDRYSEAVDIQAITVDPSAGAWAIDLTDVAGNSIFQAGAAADVSYGMVFPNPIPATAINPTTWTNITKVIIYLA